MQTRWFGLTEQEVPVVGQGTWHLETAERAAAIETLRLGLDLGMTHIDTAEMYGSGTVEEIVAEAIAGHRDEVFLVSKVLPGNASRKGTIAACQRSLARLRTDRLDCYLLHWRGQYPLEDTISAFEQLQLAGLIMSWGVSNFDVGDLEEVLEITGDDRFVCNQVLYHLQERAIEHAVLPWCRAHGVAVVAYSPFGSGEFPGPGTPEGRVLQEIATAHGATARQVALSFLSRHESVFTIPKTSKPSHAVKNAAAGDLQLTELEVAKINQAFPLGSRPRVLPTM